MLKNQPYRCTSVPASRGRRDRHEKVGPGVRAGDPVPGGTWTSAGHPIQLEILPGTCRTGATAQRFIGGRV